MAATGGLLIEKKADVFEVFESMGDDAAFVHCISADASLGAGVAASFIKRYGAEQRTFIKSTFVSGAPLVGTVVMTKVLGGRTVYHLITKARASGKPTLSSLKSALISLRSLLAEDGVKTLVMPRIGCGLDKLNWKDVSQLLLDLGLRCVVASL